MNLELVVPTDELRTESEDFKQEFFDRGEFVINGSALWDQTDSYKEWLNLVKDNTQEDTVQPNWVVSSTFFAVRKFDNKIVGIIDIRHYLNEFLRVYGGHIGYSIRPSERRKGYATEMLQLALIYTKTIGLKKVMLGCYSDNIASIKTIKKCGGVLERELLYTDGKPMQVYWINNKE